jgi:hypothetical protein
MKQEGDDTELTKRIAIIEFLEKVTGDMVAAADNHAPQRTISR